MSNIRCKNFELKQESAAPCEATLSCSVSNWQNNCKNKQENKILHLIKIMKHFLMLRDKVIVKKGIVKCEILSCF